MRLAAAQIQAIVSTAQDFFGQACRVVLFGSRLQDEARGGDIDLLIESELDMGQAVMARWKFLARLSLIIGEQSIDVVLTRDAQRDTRAVVAQALAHGVDLCKL